MLMSLSEAILALSAFVCWVLFCTRVCHPAPKLLPLAIFFQRVCERRFARLIKRTSVCNAYVLRLHLSITLYLSMSLPAVALSSEMDPIRMAVIESLVYRPGETKR